MNVSLPEALKEWVDQLVAEGRYSSASDYVRDLLRRDQDEVERRARLRAAIEHGRNSGVSKRNLQEIYDANRKRRDAA